jgi:hypothetical protein
MFLDGETGIREYIFPYLMKTTIDLPEPLYKKARIHAVEHATTLRALVIESLQKHLQAQISNNITGVRNGVPLLPLRKGSPLTEGDLNRLRDELGI